MAEASVNLTGEFAEVRGPALRAADLVAAVEQAGYAVPLATQDLANHCHGDHRPDCPILGELEGTRKQPHAARRACFPGAR